MEQAIREHPHDEGHWLVYGDWLQAQGDPRGELVAIQSAQRERPDDVLLRAEEARIIHRNRDELLGEDVAEHLDCVNLSWAFGFIQTIRIFTGPSLSEKWPIENLLTALLAHPSGQFVRELIIGQVDRSASAAKNHTELIEWLLDLELPPTIHSLFLFDDVHGRQRPARIQELERGFPALETLNLYGVEVQLEGPPPKSITKLRVHTAATIADNLSVLSQSYLAQLRDLTVHGPTIELLEVLHRATNLEALRLIELEDAEHMINEIAATPVAKTITELEVVASGLTRAPSAGQFPQVERFILDDHPDIQRYMSTFRAKGSLLGAYAHDLYSLDAHRSRFAESRLREAAGAGTLLYNEGTHLLMADDAGAAAPLLSLSLELADPIFYRQAWSNAGIAQANTGNFPAAVEIARRAIQRFPDEPNFYAILIDALRHQRLLDAALEELEFSASLIDASANGMALCQDHIFTHFVRGDFVAAARVYDDFLERKWRPRDQLRAAGGLAFMYTGRIAEAQKIVAEVRQLKDPIIHHFRACWNALKKRKSRVRAELQKMRESGYAELKFVETDDPILRGFS